MSLLELTLVVSLPFAVEARIERAVGVVARQGDVMARVSGR
jgi:hypothetical protein